jgi:pimeloyl-ACP methyl ester carboxylesterase
MRKNTRIASLLFAGLLVLTGCATTSQSASSATPVAAPSAVQAEKVAANLKPFYAQKVSWSGCGQRLYCAKVTVPADWSKPTAGSLKLAVAYRAADNAKPLGSIIFNPGGPGASGYDWILQSVDYLGTANLRAHYNMVGFDPRGVGHSQPTVKCLDAAGTDHMLYDDNGLPLGSPADVAETSKTMKAFAQACAKNTGPAMAHIDTVSAAKDIDVIRAVMGSSKLNYLGFSYGTQLGETYAALFPTKIQHMVLDGVIDPTVPDWQQSVVQLKGFDQALRNYLANCLGSSDCPFKGTVDQAMERIRLFMKGLEGTSLPTKSGRKLTVWGANTGLIMPLYSNSYWPQLSQAFTEAFHGDGTTFLALADTYNDRNANGTYADNLMEANVAISCLDGRQAGDATSMAKQNARMLAASPTLGRYWQFGALTCANWPYPVVAHPSDYSAKASPDILVVGTTGDPATPYEQAVSVANHVLAHGHLVTWHGEGHTAYGRSNSCVANAVDNYFISGTVPSTDPNC